MPSQLINSSSSSIQKNPFAPIRKQKMSLTQTYYLAHTARAKLSREAARSDHNLRRLVGHANLLDGLMLDLADAEREQQNKHIQWAESLPAVVEDYEEDSSSDDGSDSEDDEEEISYNTVTAATSTTSRRRPAPSQPLTVITTEIDMDSDSEEDDEEIEGLELRRTHSNSSPSSPSSPPELLEESDSSDSEYDSMPPSPPSADMPLDSFSHKQSQKKTEASIAHASNEDVFYDSAAATAAGFYAATQRQTVVAC